MYADSDYFDYYMELSEKFPGIQLGVQHSEINERITVNVFGSLEDAKAVLSYVREDPSFVFATRIDDKGLWLFMLMDDPSVRDKVRGAFSYFLDRYPRQRLETLFETSFISADISFLS